MTHYKYFGVKSDNHQVLWISIFAATENIGAGAQHTHSPIL